MCREVRVAYTGPGYGGQRGGHEHGGSEPDTHAGETIPVVRTVKRSGLLARP